MKKLLSMMAVALFAFVLCGCTEKAPKDVACDAMTCMKNKDYEGYVKLMYFKNQEDASKAAEVEKSREQLVSLVKDKMDKELESKQGIKDFEVADEKIEDDKATVKMKVTYGNGETKDNDMKLVKDKDGKWWLDSGK